MPLPERLPHFGSGTGPVTIASVCQVAGRWGLDPTFAEKLLRASQTLPFATWIFSGARSSRHQSATSPTPFDQSTHADRDPDGCPRLATGADVQPVSPGVRIDLSAVAFMGRAWQNQGLRWGGGAPVGDDGIPVGNERWHVDMGARPNPPR